MQPNSSREVKEGENPKPKHKSEYGWMLFLLVVTLAMVAGYFVSTKKLYKSSDTLGYSMGMTGGVMMLTLLLYPPRKRVRFMKRWSALQKWFKWHMVFGILGPMLIMFHSTFHIGSINAGVALVCMMLVSGSGIFGRFFYTKIHHGLYGRQASLQELQAEMEKSDDLKSIFGFAPDIQHSLDKFRAYATDSPKVWQLRMWNFVTIGLRAEWLSRSLTKNLHRAMVAKAHSENSDTAKMKDVGELYDEHRVLIRSYLKAARDVAQFHGYEQLFSLWHIFHIPLVIMMVFSAIWHVVAVHMF